ncbi:hypothetical protein LIER_31722 [Lithospermum erythrorhizon]|uniref:Uncharacterized protein n=1 Tax=Lithospermum erythrorhizon TaxID=34254 RepID=A0AAV3RSI9_LITER
MANENVESSDAGTQGTSRSEAIQGVFNEAHLAHLVASMGGLRYDGSPTPSSGGQDVDDVEVFAALVITDPNIDVTRAFETEHVAAGTVQIPE